MTRPNLKTLVAYLNTKPDRQSRGSLLGDFIDVRNEKDWNKVRDELTTLVAPENLMPEGLVKRCGSNSSATSPISI
jgi:hypothetical protein